MILKTSGFFSSAHFLYGYKGKCKHIHGHTYAYFIEVEVSEHDLVDDMVVDFSIVKELDHSLMVNGDSKLWKNMPEVLIGFNVIPFNSNPTAERIALYILDKIKKLHSTAHVTVRVWEDIESLVDQKDLEKGFGEHIEVSK